MLRPRGVLGCVTEIVMTAVQECYTGAPLHHRLSCIEHLKQAVLDSADTYGSSNVNTLLGLGEDNVSGGVGGALEDGNGGDTAGADSRSDHVERAG